MHTSGRRLFQCNRKSPMLCFQRLIISKPCFVFEWLLSQIHPLGGAKPLSKPAMETVPPAGPGKDYIKLRSYHGGRRMLVKQLVLCTVHPKLCSPTPGQLGALYQCQVSFNPDTHFKVVIVKENLVYLIKEHLK